jgi:hypothetical protein
MDASTDVRARYRPDPKPVLEQYNLDGTSERQRSGLLEALLEHFLDYAATGKGVAFLADMRGMLEDAQWDALVGHARLARGAWPDVLMTGSYALAGSLAGTIRLERLGMVLFAREEWIEVALRAVSKR